jgi:hypothetical protein
MAPTTRNRRAGDAAARNDVQARQLERPSNSQAQLTFQAAWTIDRDSVSPDLAVTIASLAHPEPPSWPKMSRGRARTLRRAYHAARDAFLTEIATTTGQRIGIVDGDSLRVIEPAVLQ